MSFKILRVSVCILAAAMFLHVDQASAWSLGIGRLPSCVYICLDQSVSLQSSCQDLKCICKQPNLMATNEACFRKECDLNSLSKALKLPATCQESFGITPPRDPPAESPSSPSSPPNPSPATGYPVYPYTAVPPTTANQRPSVPYYAYYPYPQVVAPLNGSVVPQPPSGTLITPVGSSSPAGGPPPQISTPPTPASPPPPQASTPAPHAPTPIAGVVNGTTNSTGARPPPGKFTSPLFPPHSNSSASPGAGDAAYASAQSLFGNQTNSPLYLLLLLSSLYSSLCL
ncbi:hypothetical protein PGT21_027800 [Puccinia graminis f. sp. tritici]|uniref:CFEM domain-containing protein n=2 Tax=Puccinia graminis f. sp. tritici TaxID=56615 RepID=A0A5B0RSS7_PUCGR|nr:hypothetical protein PGT21_027800 [Puccinia graminis f. sp. tritici]KAA1128095.1 hypothetical protein PGTUg99_006429 [Puccinia graminis f. sp. tritici]